MKPLHRGTRPLAAALATLSVLAGFVSGEFKGAGVRGTFKIRPLEGDCVTSPVTRVHVNAEFWFLPSFFTR